MQIDSTPPAIDISIDFPMIEIDDAAPKAEIGLKPTLMIARELAAAGRQAAHDGASLAGRGRATNSHGSNREPTLPLSRPRGLGPATTGRSTSTCAPKSRIKVRVHGRLEIEGAPGRMELDMEPEKVSVALRPGASRVICVEGCDRDPGRRRSLLGGRVRKEHDDEV